MASMGSLDDMFEGIMEHWTKIIFFTYSFTERALNSPRFVRPITNFIRKNVKDHVKIMEEQERIKSNTWTLRESLTSLSKLSEDDKRRKHAMHRSAQTEERLKESRRDRKDGKGKRKRSSSSSESSMSADGSPNSRKESLLSHLKRLGMKQKIRKRKPAELEHLIFERLRSATPEWLTTRVTEILIVHRNTIMQFQATFPSYWRS